MATIPRIVLDDRAVADSSDPTSSPSTTTTTTTTTTNGPTLGVGGGRGGRPLSEGGGGGGGGESPEPCLHQYVPHRCNSDIGLPTTSMPNLPLAMGLGGGGGGGGEHAGEGGDKLGVYCSPRTTRRSFDLEVGSSSRDRPHSDYDWLEDKTSSLQVLSAGSRVGSAVSLNSVCTAHSVGLLSNDSSDEYQDSFLQESALLSFPHTSERASHLRRLQSNPEAEDKSGSDANANVTPRTSYSLCNLKAAQAPTAVGKVHVQTPGQLTPEKLCMLPSEVDECEDSAVAPPGGEKETGKKKAGGGGGGGGGGGEGETAKESDTGERREDGSAKAAMVSYGKGSTTMREGRIRRWLQDMDKATE